MFQAFKDFGDVAVSANMVASDSAVNGGKIQVVVEEHCHSKIDTVIIDALLLLPIGVWVTQG